MQFWFNFHAHLNQMNKYLFFLLLFLPTLHSAAQPAAFSNQPLINGFLRSIEGEVLPYFSVYRKYAKEALLTRCTDGKKAIQWETDTIPADCKGDYAYFTWIAAHSSGTSSGVRNFDLYINDSLVLTFSTHPQQYPPYWSFAAADSSLLSFVFKTKDGAADSHGMAYLRVPLNKYRKGTPLRLKVIGQAQNSNDWYMTFKYIFKEKIEIAPLPFLLKDGKTQLLQLTVLHFGKSTALNLSIDGAREINYPLNNGFNSFEVQVPAVKEKHYIGVRAAIPNNISVEEKIALSPVIYRELNLVHHAHTDIGYSNIQEEVVQIHVNNIKRALQLVEQTRDYPPGSRFIWNIESAWAVENFLEQSTLQEKQDFFRAVKDGQIVIAALYANILTGLCMPEELNWITDYATGLRKMHQLPIETAMMSDIPGMSWNMVTALAKNGIRYFSNGPNYIEGLPGHGDRIGHTLDAMGDKPFWWVSPTGKDSILLWTAAKGYSSWHGFGQGAIYERGAEKIAEYLHELDAENYPYTLVQWRYNVVADNGPTDSTISDYVKQWNEKYASPKLVLANVNDLFHRFEKQYGKAIPAYRGDLTPYWEDGAYSTAREEALYRMTAQKIIALEQVAKQKKITLDANLLYRVKRDIVMFHEHTWGAWNSTSEPDKPFVTHQWDYKKAFGDSAVYYTKQIEQTIASMINVNGRVTVLNSLPQIRSAYVEINCPTSYTGNVLTDDQGRECIGQRLQNGKLAFMANDLPANGERTYRFSSSKKELIVKKEMPYPLMTDKNTGAINSLHQFGREWVDTSNFRGLLQALYINGLDPRQYQSCKLTQMKWIEKGPIVNVLEISCDLPGTNGLVYTISQVAGLDHLKISVSIDKKAIRSKESLHFALPFSINNPLVRIGTGDGTVSPGMDQLPAANKDFYSVQHWLDISNKAGGVTISCPQAALFEVGQMVNEQKDANGHKQWKDSAASSSLVFLYAMNNYWHTNYKADQEGKTIFDVYLKFHDGPFNKAAADRFGYACTEPVLVFYTLVDK